MNQEEWDLKKKKAESLPEGKKTEGGEKGKGEAKKPKKKKKKKKLIQFSAGLVFRP